MASAPAGSDQRGHHVQTVLNWLDPVFERQIMSMIWMRHSGHPRCSEEVWQSITEAAGRAGIHLDEANKQHDI